MNITLERLYQMIGELYIANQVLAERVKALTPKPIETPSDEQEAGVVDLARLNGTA